MSVREMGAWAEVPWQRPAADQHAGGKQAVASCQSMVLGANEAGCKQLTQWGASGVQPAALGMGQQTAAHRRCLQPSPSAAGCCCAWGN